MEHKPEIWKPRDDRGMTRDASRENVPVGENTRHQTRNATKIDKIWRQKTTKLKMKQTGQYWTEKLDLVSGGHAPVLA